MKDAIQALDQLHRIAHSTILAKSKNGLFFNNEDFKHLQGEIMVQASNRSIVEKELKNKTP